MKNSHHSITNSQHISRPLTATSMRSEEQISSLGHVRTETKRYFNMIMRFMIPKRIGPSKAELFGNKVFMQEKLK